MSGQADPPAAAPTPARAEPASRHGAPGTSLAGSQPPHTRGSVTPAGQVGVG